MIHNTTAKSLQMLCEQECDPSWGFLIGRIRRSLRHGRLNYYKMLIVVFVFCSLFTFIRVKQNGISCSFSDCSLSLAKLVRSPPLIIVVTPTYRRSTRLADMTRMANTLQHVNDLHWIVVEDATVKVKHVDRLLARTGLPYTYMAVKTIPGYPKRGWYQRTTAIQHIRNNTKKLLNGHSEGVLYFGDDDNSYDIRLFTEYIRNVKKLGVWAVGMVGGTPVESPDVQDGKVVGFKVGWNPKRKFAVDMAGFAINLRVVLNSTAVFGTSCTRGGGAPETCLLEDMGLERSDIEPFGVEKEYDRDIMVWHTKTQGANYNMTIAKLNGYIFESSPPKVSKNETKLAGVTPKKPIVEPADKTP